MPWRPRLEFETFPWGSDHYLSTGRMMPADALETLAAFDAILFGAVGSREVPDHVTLWGLRLAIVQGFDQGVSLRPARLLAGVRGPLAGRTPDDIDMVVVRENTEGEYSGIGGFTRRGLPGEVAVQTTVYSHDGIARTARYAFELARTREARHVTSVTKSNASPHASVLWDEVVASVAAEFPDVSWQSMLVDAAAARLVLAPQEFDVIVASNLHGDILSDLTGALAGQPRHGAERQPQPRRLAPVDVRARPRLGVRSRRSRAGQPHRDGALRRAHARRPRTRATAPSGCGARWRRPARTGC